PTPGVQLERSIDDRWVLALVDGALADGVGLIAEPLQTEAHATAPARPPASVARAITNAGSRLASSQPARGPFGRSRNARQIASEGPLPAAPSPVSSAQLRGRQ